MVTLAVATAANVILSAIGHNFRRILAQLRKLLRFILVVLWRPFGNPIALTPLVNGRRPQLDHTQTGLPNLD